MPRHQEVPRRVIHPDPKFGDRMVSKFINILMIGGKKSVAESIVYGAFDIVKGKTQEDPVKVFKRAVDNIKPQVEVRSRRVGGANYQVPSDVRPDRRIALAFRWLRDYSAARSERTMCDSLAAEILEASQGRGGAVKKRDDTHRMAEANRAFAHYRW